MALSRRLLLRNDFGLGLLDRLGCDDLCSSGLGLRLGLYPVEGGFQVGSAIGAEADAAGQFLATTVAKLGIILLDSTGIGRVAIGGIRVVAYNERSVLVGAHGKALWTHDLAVVYHKFLFGYRHPFTALWAL